MIYSFDFELSSIMAPKEVSYLVSFAGGHIATCDAQGFLVIVANGVSVCYNCSVCLYYLGIITYKRSMITLKRSWIPGFMAFLFYYHWHTVPYFWRQMPSMGRTEGFALQIQRHPRHRPRPTIVLIEWRAELKSLEALTDEEGNKFHFASIYTLIKRLLKIIPKMFLII